MRSVADNTRHAFNGALAMPKPTKATRTPKPGDSRGKKSEPPTALEGDGGSRPDPTSEHTENIAHQKNTHNIDSDRGETENLSDQEKREPQDRYSPGLSNHSKVGRGQFNADAWHRQVFSARIHATSKLLLLCLGQLADGDGECSPTQTEVAYMMNAARGTVMTAISKMEAAGWIEVDRDHTMQGHKLHRYTLMLFAHDEDHVQK